MAFFEKMITSKINVIHSTRACQISKWRMGEWADSYQDNYKVIIPLNFKLPKSKGNGMSLEECIRQSSVGPVPGFNCRCTSFITDQYEVFNLDKISKVHKPRVHGKINLISILRE